MKMAIRTTLKYFSLLINVNRKLILFMSRLNFEWDYSYAIYVGKRWSNIKMCMSVTNFDHSFLLTGNIGVEVKCSKQK